MGTSVNCGFCHGTRKVTVGKVTKTCLRCSGTGKVTVNQVHR